MTINRSKMAGLALTLVVMTGACGTDTRDKASPAEGPAGRPSDLKAPAGADKGMPFGGPEPDIAGKDEGGSGGDGGGGGDAVQAMPAPGAGQTQAQAPRKSDGSAKASSGIAQKVGIPPVPDIPPPGGSKVIKNASIEVRIKKGTFQRQFTRASTVAEQLGGYVTNSSVNEVKGKVSAGSLTIRVPSDRFQTAMTRLKDLGKVISENQSGQDVSKEFVDLEARLRHAKAQEAFYLRLLDESKSISDLVQVQQQLSGVQLQIEEIQGQLQFLKDQTSYSTITSNIFEPGAASPSPVKGLGKAWQEAGDSFQRVLGAAVVGLGWLAPFALMGLIGFGIWKAARRPKTKPAETQA